MAEPTQPPAMSISEALNELAKFKNVFRAAERIEDVMLAVSRAEGRTAELEKTNKDLEDKIKSAQSYADGQDAALAEKQRQFEEYEKDLEGKTIAARRKYDADMAELGKHYADTSVAAREKVAADLKTEQDKVDELTAKKSDLQRDIRMLEAEIQALQTRASTLGPIEQPK